MPKSIVDGVDILLSFLKGLVALTFDGVIFTFLEILFNNFVVKVSWLHQGTSISFRHVPKLG